MRGAGLAGALCLFAAACGPPAEEAPAERPSADAERVEGFWSTYRRATRARLDGRYAEAVEAYRAALETEPAHQDSLFYLATSLEAEGRYDDAVATLRQLVEIYPEHGRGWSQLGSVLGTHAPGAPFDLAGAEAAFRRSESINPEHSGPFVDLGKVALERGDLEEAAGLFATAADMGSPEGRFLEGLVALLRGRPDAAMTSFGAVFDKRAKEREIAGKGVSSEGDVDPESLTPLESAYVRSRVFAYWASRRLGGYPESVREVDRLEPPELPGRLAVREIEGEAALADLDGDGRLEILRCSPSGLFLEGRSEPLSPARLEDVVAFDADGDGRVDLYGVGREGSVLLANEGGRFEDVTGPSGLGGSRSTARAAAGDFDGDGKLDLLEVGEGLGQDSSVRLFLRRGERYEESAAARGVDDEGHLVDVAVADVNGDEALDLYLLGWKRPGRLFVQRGGRFEDRTREAGLDGVGGEGLRAIFFDYDGDADPDLLVTAYASFDLSLLRTIERTAHFEKATPRLFRNEGGGRFTEVTAEVGLDRAFGIVDAEAMDIDGDGHLDLLFAEGGLEASHFAPSVALRNAGGRFVDWAYLPAFDAPRRATGIAAGDLDGDGRPEIALSVAGRLPR